MLSFRTPRFLLLLNIFSTFTIFIYAQPVPASNLSSQAANVTAVANFDVVPKPPPTISSFIPRDGGHAKPVNYAYVLKSHRPVGYAYLPTAQADEYKRNKQVIPLSELQTPGITGHGSTDRYLLQRLFPNSTLSDYRTCIVFSPKSKLPKNLSDRFSMRYGLDLGLWVSPHTPPAYTEESTIGFNQMTVPTRKSGGGFDLRDKRTVMRLPYACVQMAEEIELHVQCDYPYHVNAPVVPQFWGSANWHKWKIPMWPDDVFKGPKPLY
ncbi:hypothetical protein GGU10DRAFT_356341 [Lentinula aff. detonsa]|uniref:Uncharacterized protein n=1 Tax=Lentinula aff. detonsa TaxID=2804958 RepID=A0AA38KZ70_9AGAR|nr:hypothetical protein GGU10DRAFT_356341 [Lentinula aff. detonsa]